MLRLCKREDFEAIYRIINEAACAYKGVIPSDRWKEPYMSESELQREMAEDVSFWGYEEAGELVGVMGIQHVRDVTLIRHSYVRPGIQNRGVGGALLSHLMTQTRHPMLVGTWADAVRAIRFYEKHGFRLVSSEVKDQLLRIYWSVPDRQIETSVVLASRDWFEGRDGSVL